MFATVMKCDVDIRKDLYAKCCGRHSPSTCTRASPQASKGDGRAAQHLKVKVVAPPSASTRLDRRLHPRLALHLPADVDLQAGVTTSPAPASFTASVLLKVFSLGPCGSIAEDAFLCAVRAPLVGPFRPADLARPKRWMERVTTSCAPARRAGVGVGRNDYGSAWPYTTNSVVLPQAMFSVTNASDVSAGSYHSCLIDSQVKCVGFNLFYQLGDGTIKRRSMLTPVLGLDSGIQEVYCGYYASCARMTSGKAQCWGQFANVVRTSPVNITLPGGIQSISLGYLHACILEVGGKLYCMGLNADGQLGTGNIADQAAPIQVVGLAAENIVSVACGYIHTCAVNTAGAMFCWGESDNGRLGNPSITSDSPNPVQVTGITSGAASAWAGWYNSFALMQNGTVWAFGRDAYGVFGTGARETNLCLLCLAKGCLGWWRSAVDT
ncbi:hypothetical protein BASA81_003474 [Batrachochytrium salamandrivorans]|nr:hypothetical protein BASA81_003474 [Batrachochytrium salamandrivorans]